MKLTTLIFDMDGVIVDNTFYEEAVIKSIKEWMAKNFSISFDEADKRWNKVRETTKGTALRPSYKYFCEQVDVPKAVYLKIHKDHLDKLKIHQEAIDIIRKHGGKYSIFVATERL